MYQSHFGLHRQPFVGVDPVRTWVESASVRRIVPRVLHAIRTDLGFALVTGAAGSGKSALLRRMQQLVSNEFRSVLCSGSALQDTTSLRQTIQQATARKDVGEAAIVAWNRGQLVEQLQKSLELWGPLLLLIDDVQSVPTCVLQELRSLTEEQLTGRSLLRAVVTGPLSFEEDLSRSGYAEFSQRIRCHEFLEPLTSAESAEFLAKQLEWSGGLLDRLFASSAVEEVLHAAAGSPRCLCLLADESLLSAAAKSRELVSLECVRESLDRLRHLPYAWQSSSVVDASEFDLAANADNSVIELSRKLQSQPKEARRSADAFMGVIEFGAESHRDFAASPSVSAAVELEVAAIVEDVLGDEIPADFTVERGSWMVDEPDVAASEDELSRVDRNSAWMEELADEIEVRDIAWDETMTTISQAVSRETSFVVGNRFGEPEVVDVNALHSPTHGEKYTSADAVIVNLSSSSDASETEFSSNCSLLDWPGEQWLVEDRFSSDAVFRFESCADGLAQHRKAGRLKSIGPDMEGSPVSLSEKVPARLTIPIEVTSDVDVLALMSHKCSSMRGTFDVELRPEVVKQHSSPMVEELIEDGWMSIPVAITTSGIASDVDARVVVFHEVTDVQKELVTEESQLTRQTLPTLTDLNVVSGSDSVLLWQDGQLLFGRVNPTAVEGSELAPSSVDGNEEVVTEATQSDVPLDDYFFTVPTAIRSVDVDLRSASLDFDDALPLIESLTSLRDEVTQFHADSRERREAANSVNQDSEDPLFRLDGPGFESTRQSAFGAKLAPVGELIVAELTLLDRAKLLIESEPDRAVEVVPVMPDAVEAPFELREPSAVLIENAANEMNATQSSPVTTSRGQFSRLFTTLRARRAVDVGRR